MTAVLRCIAIQSPDDLPILADMLNDAGRRGERLVRWLIRKHKWPGWSNNYAFSKTMGPVNKYGIYGSKIRSLPQDEFPSKLVRPNDKDGFDWEWFDTPSEAIWTIIERYEANPCELPATPTKSGE